VGSNQQIYANLTTNNASSSSTSSSKHWLISPEIDLSANTEDSLLLSFDIALRAQSSDIPNPNTDLLEQFMVIVSTDGAKTWKAEDAIIWSTDIEGEYNFNGFYANGKFLTKYIDLSKYAGQTINLAFYIYSFADKQVAGSKNIVLLDNIQLNKYTLVENSDEICRWEDYVGYGFDIDADLLPTGTNLFERFTPAKKDSNKDLIERLTITVEAESVNELEGVVLCEGDTYKGYGFEFIAVESCVYKQKLQSGIGCDSTVILNVIVNKKQYENVEATICQGSYYEFNGVKYYTNTIQSDTLTAANGCDSIVTLYLTVNPILEGETLVVNRCPDDPAYYFTEKYPALTEDGIYTDTVQNNDGCDSIASVQIINREEAYTFFRAAICQGEVYDVYPFGGLRNPGDYSTPGGEQGLHTIYGCDSIVTLHLLVATPTDEQTFMLEDSIAVNNLPYVLNDVEILPVGTEVGVYTRTINLNCGEATLVITVGYPQSINNTFVNSLAVMPNPAQVGEPIRILGTFDDATVEVTSATGALVYTAQNLINPITIPGMPVAGVYLIRVRENGRIYQAKLMVK
ncbi:MAG: choice-of-anchor J domain-containing protein, partial [Paludibacteraceae bacterium]|nr:choice-of-anchor J domain-containing protein [Paludibacteraceae bacterium]